MTDTLIWLYRTLLPLGNIAQISALLILFTTVLNADLFKEKPRTRGAFMVSLGVLIVSNVAGLANDSNFDGTPYWPLFWGRWGGAAVFWSAILMHWRIFRKALLGGTILQRFLPESEQSK